ncbi:Na+/H+ antiporter NhaC family protein [Virgibacillus sp. 179-BFC.A HS]|uniref:Na+/H+ antiporter NhaC family protein n=1 Tax=Tigheibacillus jepli TaxID=3035914 RepID=A0ABU5CLR5_9BACI|nr:Na+/H+ antiporter NhaC family protein [Virgibacillus sp. 179-BFC.A HS]MDY0406841.1 Na+/H+ antiporter NhaC family protein [Virgibacillus sp. 179-BFC.A HS]
MLVTEKVAGISAFSAFLQMIPMNFYVWAALGTVVIIAIRQVDFGPMRMYEVRAMETGEVLDPEKSESVDAESDLPTSNFGKISDLVIPIAVLFVATVGFIYFTGWQAVGGGKSLMVIFGEADVSKSLLYGGVFGIAATFILFMRHAKMKELNGNHFIKGIVAGAKSMLPAFAILIFAWAIVDLIDQLGTGVYLSEVVKGANISLSLLPLIVFLMAGFIAFATGTSWGSFALLLPIAGKIAMVTDPDLLLPMLAAVLAGSVFGDHCSPISDTTILSSTGSSCHHIDHVTTQLPYALVSAVIAGSGYLALGLSGSVWLGLGIVFVGLAILYASLHKPLAFTDEKEEPVAK